MEVDGTRQCVLLVMYSDDNAECVDSFIPRSMLVEVMFE